MEKDPNTLEVSVSDDVSASEVMGQPDQPMSREELMQKVLERKVFLSSKYAKAHQKKSRLVTEADIPRVIEDSNLMAEMCLVGRGEYNIAHALAHSQIEEEDPLRFFVLRRQEDGQPFIFINPVIRKLWGDLEGIQEGCMSYPEEPLKTVFRFKKATMEFQTLAQSVDKNTGKELSGVFLSDVVKQNYSGLVARIVQHEVAHLNGWNIYNDGYTATCCEGGVDKKETPIIITL